VWEDVLGRNPGNKSAEMYLSLVRDMGTTAPTPQEAAAKAAEEAAAKEAAKGGAVE